MIENNCVFCSPESEIIAENEYALAFYDKYPVTRFHTLIIPKRHVADYFDLKPVELAAIQELLFEQKEKLMKEDESITGFNIGINVGADAGQTVFLCAYASYTTKNR